ncbi:gamma-glutamyl-gamma-aminobutyrate hydrolase family protein [Streptomyces sp. NBC_01408]|uniref:gamma-glutamyl-gamma-aminobutyrate hydrolase family protein n=1 Tax=Streptomyces sp. NBC_01408 TaxID=2903855 RepID=UPI00224E5199|nr:gamma-glutamyl-gamma-aminobutyrate hydrolase family protein [Streptomyces sp. NBC_01408]MCX4695633.1 gamma-glutamyl-gamma-aminobutyrate hydrolase family protein [Streptomyces sp. NBC_01408]
MTHRPLIAVPARFSASASALRYAADVNARALVEAVYAAGGEPFTLHPHAPGGHADPTEIALRLARCDALLLPGGGDIAPHRYGAGDAHPDVYDVDDEQDAFDLALARHALDTDLPMLAVCRGLQVVNTALNGTLRQDMGGPAGEHRHRTHPVAVEPGSLLAGALGQDKADVSCYHHQCVDRLGHGLTVTARAADGTVEAVERPGSPGWVVAVQWHPEDTAATDGASRALFEALVEEALRR